jgi:photosystem II stability/assembly factor-like uncharacterized protein
MINNIREGILPQQIDAASFAKVFPKLIEGKEPVIIPNCDYQINTEVSQTYIFTNNGASLLTLPKGTIIGFQCEFQNDSEEPITLVYNEYTYSLPILGVCIARWDGNAWGCTTFSNRSLPILEDTHRIKNATRNTALSLKDMLASIQTREGYSLKHIRDEQGHYYTKQGDPIARLKANTYAVLDSNYGESSYQSHIVLPTGRILITFGSDVLLLGSSILYSDDDGKTWTKSTLTEPANTHPFVLLYRLSNGTLLCSMNDGRIWRSDSDGELWYPYSSIARDNTGESGAGVFKELADGTLLWRSVTGNYGIRYSSDGGMSWVDTNVMEGSCCRVSDVLQVTEETIVCTGGLTNGDGLMYSLDRGRTWKPSNITANTFIGIVELSSGVLLTVNNLGSIYRSIDYGVTWNISPSHLVEEPLSLPVQLSGGRCLAFERGTFAHNVWISEDDGFTWQAVPLPLYDFPVLHVGMHPSGVIFCGSSSEEELGVLYSEDGGDTWHRSNVRVGRYTYPIITLNGEALLVRIPTLFGDNPPYCIYSDNGITWDALIIEGVYDYFDPTPKDVPVTVIGTTPWTLNSSNGMKESHYIEEHTASCERLSFTTTRHNMKLVLHLKIGAGEEDIIAVSKLDTAISRTGVSNGTFYDSIEQFGYKRVIMSIPTIGTHFIEIAYIRGSNRALGSNRGWYKVISAEYNGKVITEDIKAKAITATHDDTLIIHGEGTYAKGLFYSYDKGAIWNKTNIRTMVGEGTGGEFISFANGNILYIPKSGTKLYVCPRGVARHWVEIPVPAYGNSNPIVVSKGLLYKNSVIIAFNNASHTCYGTSDGGAHFIEIANTLDIASFCTIDHEVTYGVPLAGNLSKFITFTKDANGWSVGEVQTPKPFTKLYRLSCGTLIACGERNSTALNESIYFLEEGSDTWIHASGDAYYYDEVLQLESGIIIATVYNPEPNSFNGLIHSVSNGVTWNKGPLSFYGELVSKIVTFVNGLLFLPPPTLTDIPCHSLETLNPEEFEQCYARSMYDIPNLSGTVQLKEGTIILIDKNRVRNMLTVYNSPTYRGFSKEEDDKSSLSAIEDDGVVLFHKGAAFGLLRSTDCGLSWYPVNPSWRSFNSPKLLSNGIYSAGSRDSGIWYSRDKGKHWRPSSLQEGCYFTPLEAENGVLLAGSKQGGLVRSDDKGITWKRVIPYGSFDTPTAKRNRNPIMLVGSPSFGGIFRSNNSGATWERVLGDMIRPPVSPYIESDPIDRSVTSFYRMPGTTDMLAVIEETALYYSDNGDIWVRIFDVSAADEVILEVAPIDASLTVVTTNYKTYSVELLHEPTIRAVVRTMASYPIKGIVAFTRKNILIGYKVIGDLKLICYTEYTSQQLGNLWNFAVVEGINIVETVYDAICYNENGAVDTCYLSTNDAIYQSADGICWDRWREATGESRFLAFNEKLYLIEVNKTGGCAQLMVHHIGSTVAPLYLHPIQYFNQIRIITSTTYNNAIFILYNGYNHVSGEIELWMIKVTPEEKIAQRLSPHMPLSGNFTAKAFQVCDPRYLYISVTQDVPESLRFSDICRYDLLQETYNHIHTIPDAVAVHSVAQLSDETLFVHHTVLREVSSGTYSPLPYLMIFNLKDAVVSYYKIAAFFFAVYHAEAKTVCAVISYDEGMHCVYHKPSSSSHIEPKPCIESRIEELNLIRGSWHTPCFITNDFCVVGSAHGNAGIRYSVDGGLTFRESSILQGNFYVSKLGNSALVTEKKTGKSYLFSEKLIFEDFQYTLAEPLIQYGDSQYYAATSDGELLTITTSPIGDLSFERIPILQEDSLHVSRPLLVTPSLFVNQHHSKTDKPTVVTNYLFNNPRNEGFSKRWASQKQLMGTAYSKTIEEHYFPNTVIYACDGDRLHYMVAYDYIHQNSILYKSFDKGRIWFYIFRVDEKICHLRFDYEGKELYIADMDAEDTTDTVEYSLFVSRNYGETFTFERLIIPPFAVSHGVRTTNQYYRIITSKSMLQLAQEDAEVVQSPHGKLYVTRDNVGLLYSKNNGKDFELALDMFTHLNTQIKSLPFFDLKNVHNFTGIQAMSNGAVLLSFTDKVAILDKTGSMELMEPIMPVMFMRAKNSQGIQPLERVWGFANTYNSEQIDNTTKVVYTDDGKTWRYAPEDVNGRVIVDLDDGLHFAVSGVIHPNYPTQPYSKFPRGVLRSTDYGRTWKRTNITTGIWGRVRKSKVHTLVASPYAPYDYEALDAPSVAHDRRIQGIWYSDDNGISWHISDITVGYWHIIGATDTKLVAVASDKNSDASTLPASILYSSNGGRNWFPTAVQGELFKVPKYINNLLLLQAISGRLYTSPDNGISYTRPFPTWNMTHESLVVVDEDNMLVFSRSALQITHIDRFTLSLTTFHLPYEVLDDRMEEVKELYGNTFFAKTTANRFIVPFILTHTGSIKENTPHIMESFTGKLWQCRYIAFKPVDTTEVSNPLIIPNSNNLCVCANNGFAYYSTNNGESFAPQKLPGKYSHAVHLMIPGLVNRIIIAGESGFAYADEASKDNHYWNPLEDSPYRHIIALAVLDDVIFASTRDGYILISQDFGKSFVPLHKGFGFYTSFTYFSVEHCTFSNAFEKTLFVGGIGELLYTPSIQNHELIAHPSPFAVNIHAPFKTAKGTLIFPSLTGEGIYYIEKDSFELQKSNINTGSFTLPRYDIEGNLVISSTDYVHGILYSDDDGKTWIGTNVFDESLTRPMFTTNGTMVTYGSRRLYLSPWE